MNTAMRTAMNAAPMSWPQEWLVPQWPAPAHVKALCTTRAGGVSVPPYGSLNLGTHVGDALQCVQRNRATLQQLIGARPVFMDQVHGTQMLALQAHTPDGLSADGASTTQAGLACTVMVADCLPILLCDRAGQRVAAVHAGWRGLLGQETTAGAAQPGTGYHGVVEAIFKHFVPVAPVNSAQSAPEIIAWLGPCIGPQAFEVGAEVRAAFVAAQPQAASCFAPLPHNKWLADLPALARQRLHALGVFGIYGNDGSDAWCTVGNPQRFFSHRRDGVSGRQAACIWLE
jgi:copper oxidase (laccase) domain-containing protein